MTHHQDPSTGPLVQIVPNFSEGRRTEVIDALVDALSVPGVILLNRHPDPDHNRLDVTLVGGMEAVCRSALAGAARAMELIDMEQHHGSHPRMGAVDVIPFVPLRDVTMDQCVALARDVAREIGETLGLPVYCYDQAALVPERRSLADVRRGEFEGLRADVSVGNRLPDFGPHEIGRAGAVAVGARKPLIPFNVYLAGTDEAKAKGVARAVREATGGLRNVRAIGFFVPERGCLTVSMNLVDYEATPIHRAFEMVRLEAARLGLTVLDCEIVGLVPQAALSSAADFYLQLQGFDPEAQIIENALRRADGGAGQGRPPEIDAQAVGAFLDRLASPEPTPGGGSAAAGAGPTAAALVAMVARLTMGKEGYEDVEARMGQIAAEADAARTAFLALADRDAEAFDAVMAAYRLPKDTEEQKGERSTGIQRALTAAAGVPGEVADRAVAMMELAREVTERGNASTISDGAAAAQILFAACRAALANVDINLGSIKDPETAERMRQEAARLRARSAEVLGATDVAFAARLAG